MSQITVYLREWCPYCHRARALLDAKKVDYREVDIESDRALAEEMLQRSGGRRTVPQIFIGELHIGGYDDMAALDRAGKLDALLDEATAATGD